MKKDIYNRYKKIKEYCNNKGMAFVTVLIAITFISLLAASLLFMTYLNYKTKIARYNSTNNFYSDEFAFDEVSSELQETAANSSSIDDAYAAIRSQVGADATFTGDTGKGSGKYNPNQLDSLLNVSNTSNGCTISFNTAVGCEPTYKETSSSIILENVTAVSTDNKGYYSSITSDIVINFPSASAGDYDVNDFSIISNSFMASSGENSTGGTICFTGCMFLKHPAGDNVALHCETGKAITIVSPMALFDGDITVTGNSILTIAGDVVVDGTIKVEAGSVLCVSGSLKVKKGSTFSGTIKAGGATPSDPKGPYANIQLLEDSFDVPDAGLADELFNENFYVKNASNDFVNIGTADSNYKLPINYLCDGTENYRKTVGTKPNVRFQIDTPDVTNDGDLDRLLIMTSGDVTIRNGGVSSTILTLGSVKMDQRHISPYTKMTDEDYATAKGLMFEVGHGQLRDNANWKFGSGDWTTFINKIKAAKSSSDIKIYKWNYSENKDPVEVSPSSLDDDTINALTPDDEIRYLVVEKSGSDYVNYIPAGYLLVPKTKEVINKYFSLTGTQADPKNTSVSYRNFLKN